MRNGRSDVESEHVLQARGKNSLSEERKELAGNQEAEPTLATF